MPAWVVPAIMAGSSLLAGLLGGRRGQETPPPTQQTPMFPGAGDTLINWLMSNFSQKEDGGWEFRPSQSYPGELNVNLMDTLLPQAWAGTQQNQGIDALSAFLASGGAQNPMQAMWPQIQQWGGVAGNPLTNIESMISQGGTGGVGNNAMRQIMNWGAPEGSSGAQYMSNLANYGIASTGAGAPTHAMAYGLPNAVTASLQPFMNVPQWRTQRAV